MNKVTLEKNTAWVEDMNESKNNYCEKRVIMVKSKLQTVSLREQSEAAVFLLLECRST